MPATRPRKANGHRWRQVEARVLAEETHCALCDDPVDKTLDRMRDPRAAVVDHDWPLDRGGPEYDRENCLLMHRQCNRWKSTMTLAEALAKRNGTPPPRPVVISSPGWGPNA